MRDLGSFIYSRVNYTPSQGNTHSPSIGELGQVTVWVGGQNSTASSAYSLIYHLRNLFNWIIVSCFLKENIASKCISSEQAGAGSCLDWTSLHSKSAWDSLDTNYAGFPFTTTQVGPTQAPAIGPPTVLPGRRFWKHGLVALGLVLLFPFFEEANVFLARTVCVMNLGWSLSIS